MDIKEIVSMQLHAVGDVESLQIQNHIYGCFVLMEDIVEKKIVLDGYQFKGTNYAFHLDQQFSQIGIRYGFAMDTKLLVTACLPEYKDAWLRIFTTISTLDEVDRIEDELIDIITMSVEPKMAFFRHALDTGSLPQEWIDHMITLLVTPPLPVEPVEPVNPVAHVISINKPKKFRVTKRNPITITKFLGKTRRVIKH
jgi:hypothetical protein